MRPLEEAAHRFLELERIAVVGVSRDSRQPANLIYRTLRTGQRQIFAVNPNATTAEGDVCYPNLSSIPRGVQGAVIVTTPKVACAVIDECAALGVRSVWLHRSFGEGSVSPEAVERCRRHGLEVIPGACPMMLRDGADIPHRCMKFVLGLFGKLPTPIASGAPEAKERRAS